MSHVLSFLTPPATDVGGDKYIPSWDALNRTHAVVILTVELLWNRLESGEARLADCSLIVLDECHSTMDNHSYNKVRRLERWLRARDTSGDGLPRLALGRCGALAWLSSNSALAKLE